MTVDGSLIFNTKIDEDGFNKGAKGLSSKVIDLKNKISATETAIKNLKAEMEKTGNVKVKTKVAEGLEKDVAKAQEKLNFLDLQADRFIEKKRADFGIDVNDDSTLADLISEKYPEFEKTWSNMTTVDDKGKISFTKNREEMISGIDKTITALEKQYMTEAVAEQQQELIKARTEATVDYNKAMGELSTAQDGYNDVLAAYSKASEEAADAQTKFNSNRQHSSTGRKGKQRRPR